MGTHPIFESDFDCLTEKKNMESTILTKPECLVYRLPPRNSVRGYRAADWGLDKPSWTGRMRITARDEKVSIKLEDTTNGQLFAECPITEYPTKDIESVNDSSRYFVLRIQNQGRSAFIGIGFRDRGDSFDFNVALQDHYKWVKNANEPSVPDNAPKLNLGLAEGQTIKINLAGKMNADRERPKPASTSGISLLPPPPSKSNPAAPSGNLLNLAPPPSCPSCLNRRRFWRFQRAHHAKFELGLVRLISKNARIHTEHLRESLISFNPAWSFNMSLRAIFSSLLFTIYVQNTILKTTLTVLIILISNSYYS